MRSAPSGREERDGAVAAAPPDRNSLPGFAADTIAQGAAPRDLALTMRYRAPRRRGALRERGRS